ncbi:sensor histidine kinase [Streptomyces sp. NBC_01537]|uniref:sensor histidine kinase n=1 Tax=Streptomyces sp. NBC_01537 TaxID=2903896 RepID=UPI00386B70CC
MSADVPLEKRARRLREADGARDSDVHSRTFYNWDAYFAVVWAGTLAFALGAKDPALPVRTAAAALFCLLVPWYVWAGRPEMMTEGANTRPSARYIVGAVGLFMVSAVLVGETRLVTFALVPQCFMLLRMRWALVALTVINIVPVVGWGLLWRPDSEDLFLNSVFAVVTLTFSTVMGSWVIRILDQSRDRAALIAELDASRLELATLSSTNGALAERERMSREIHDTLAQGFTSLLMLAQAVQSELDHDPRQARRHVGLMVVTARENLAEARALVAGARPTDLVGSSLQEALHRLGDRFSTETGHPVPFVVTGETRWLPAAVEVVALRSAQEALSNARRHAGAQARVELGLSYDGDALRLSVRDTGSGFDPGSPGGGYGLPGMRARAEEIGGTAHVLSAPGKGTTVTVELPLGAAARSAP